MCKSKGTFRRLAGNQNPVGIEPLESWAQVLLLDEITVDMDVVGRLDLLQFFKEECEQRGATIVYATHIFDGLAQWVTHLAYVADGQLIKGATAPLRPLHSWYLAVLSNQGALRFVSEGSLAARTRVLSCCW